LRFQYIFFKPPHPQHACLYVWSGLAKGYDLSTKRDYDVACHIESVLVIQQSTKPMLMNGLALNSML
jgi:hypothetical protein